MEEYEDDERYLPAVQTESGNTVTGHGLSMEDQTNNLFELLGELEYQPQIAVTEPDGYSGSGVSWPAVQAKSVDTVIGPGSAAEPQSNDLFALLCEVEYLPQATLTEPDGYAGSHVSRPAGQANSMCPASSYGMGAEQQLTYCSSTPLSGAGFQPLFQPQGAVSLPYGYSENTMSGWGHQTSRVGSLPLLASAEAENTADNSLPGLSYSQPFTQQQGSFAVGQGRVASAAHDDISTNTTVTGSPSGKINLNSAEVQVGMITVASGAGWEARVKPEDWLKIQLMHRTEFANCSITPAEAEQYECNKCGKVYRYKSHLERHIRTYTGEKPYECSVCEKRFSERYHLADHMRIHSGEKPYPCTLCGKKFAVKSTLNEHLSVHTGEKPYQCNVCRKKFRLKKHLKKHNAIHSADRPYECFICGLRLRAGEGLNIHLRNHAGEI